MAQLRLLQHHAGFCCIRLTPHSIPLPPPLISCSFNPLLSEGRTEPTGDLHAEAGPNPKLNPGRYGNKEEKGKFLPVASGAVD